MVHESTGFQPYLSRDLNLPASLSVLVIGFLILVVESLSHPVQFDHKGYLMAYEGVGGLVQLGPHPQLEVPWFPTALPGKLKALKGLYRVGSRALHFRPRNCGALVSKQISVCIIQYRAVKCKPTLVMQSLLQSLMAT